jgi:hypothetical protein
MASLLALLLAGTAACGNIEDSTPQPTDQSAGGMSSSCMTIDHTVNIDEQSDLAAFSGLSCFTVEGHLFVQESTDIINLDALSGLRSVTGYIGIADNTKLRRVTLPNLKKTGEGLVVEGNHKLESISFPKLDEVGGYLHVFNNARLQKASFSCLEKVGGDVIFAGVNELTKLKLPCLKKVGGTFIFEHSDKLEFLCLPQLRYVGGSFLVHFNRDLKAILAPKLKLIGDMLEIQRNPKLVKVDLRSLEKVKGDVEIVYNHKWSKCKVHKLIKHIDYIGGHTIAHSNYRTCRSVSINPPKWCASDACKSCKCKKGEYCEEPGDDDDDDDEPTCKESCKKYAKKVCQSLKGHPYLYKKCVKKKTMKCVKKRCEVNGDDDDDDDGYQACTPGYWKNHPASWICEGYSPDRKLNMVFSVGYLVDSNTTLADALRFGGGPGAEGGAKILLRHAVASLLNACHSGVMYPSDWSVTDIIESVNTALGSGDRQQMLSLARTLDDINNQYECPLGGRAMSAPHQK